MDAGLASTLGARLQRRAVAQAQRLQRVTCRQTDNGYARLDARPLQLRRQHLSRLRKATLLTARVSAVAGF